MTTTVEPNGLHRMQYTQYACYSAGCCCLIKIPYRNQYIFIPSHFSFSWFSHSISLSPACFRMVVRLSSALRLLLRILNIVIFFSFFFLIFTIATKLSLQHANDAKRNHYSFWSRLRVQMFRFAACLLCLWTCRVVVCVYMNFGAKLQ